MMLTDEAWHSFHTERRAFNEFFMACAWYHSLCQLLRTPLCGKRAGLDEGYRGGLDEGYRGGFRPAPVLLILGSFRELAHFNSQTSMIAIFKFL